MEIMLFSFSFAFLCFTHSSPVHVTSRNQCRCRDGLGRTRTAIAVAPERTHQHNHSTSRRIELSNRRTFCRVRNAGTRPIRQMIALAIVNISIIVACSPGTTTLFFRREHWRQCHKNKIQTNLNILSPRPCFDFYVLTPSAHRPHAVGRVFCAAARSVGALSRGQQPCGGTGRGLCDDANECKLADWYR